MQEIIKQIRVLHKEHCFMVKQRIKLENGLGAFVRTKLGWKAELPEIERKRIEKAAAKAIAENDKRWVELIEGTKAAVKATAPLENSLRRRMEKLAVQLPVWDSWGDGVRAFGEHSLAVIVGEAGDLSIPERPDDPDSPGYPDFPQLWKRLGLAVMDGIAQGKLPPGTHADVWLKHGYNPTRRSKIHMIGESMLKGNHGRYKEYYDTRKVKELERVKTKMHAHMRAMRYMEKMLIKHLWQAWNGLPVAGSTTAAVSKDQKGPVEPALI